MNTSLNAAAERQYAKDAKILERPSFQRLSSSSRCLLDGAESKARGLDDNHVGTEHIVLAFFGLGHGVATHALESLGVTRELFAAQLHEEPGPSPSGTIPLTPRARMIVADPTTSPLRPTPSTTIPCHGLRFAPPEAWTPERGRAGTRPARRDRRWPWAATERRTSRRRR